MKESILWPASIKEGDVGLVGGKAMNLAFMYSRGIRVPAAFFVTTEVFRRCVTRTAGVRERSPFEDLGPVTAEIEVPAEIRKEILSAYNALIHQIRSTTSVAVRSSATAEDAPGSSFAGQFSTRLNVRGESDLLQAVADCWSSLFTPRVRAYVRRHKLPADSISLAVIVQQMIDSSVSGIMFTTNPVTGDQSQMVIEAAWGLGEGIVSGALTPDTYIIDKNTLEVCQKTVGTKSVMTKPSSDGSGTRQVETPEQMQSRECLTADQLRILSETGKHIEALYSSRQDIEWTIDGQGLLYILQSRPITAG